MGEKMVPFVHFHLDNWHGFFRRVRSTTTWDQQTTWVHLLYFVVFSHLWLAVCNPHREKNTLILA